MLVTLSHSSTSTFRLPQSSAALEPQAVSTAVPVVATDSATLICMDSEPRAVIVAVEGDGSSKGVSLINGIELFHDFKFTDYETISARGT